MPRFVQVYGTTAYHPLPEFANRILTKGSTSIEQLALVVVEVPPTPQPLNVWIAGSPGDFRSNPFQVSYRGQPAGTVLPATYLPVPRGHALLDPGEADNLDLQVASQVLADLKFRVQVTHRVTNESEVHSLTLPQDFEVVFSNDTPSRHTVVESRSSCALGSPPVGEANDNGVTRHGMGCSSYRDTKEPSRSSKRDTGFPSHVRPFQARDICGSCTIGPSAETNSE
jgi:hypothetical protein